MSSILFLIDNFEGHIIPSFKLAHSLKGRGYDIFYVSVADHKRLVEEQGFRFYPFFESIYPEGFNRDYKKHGSTEDQYNQMVKFHLAEIMEGGLDNIMKEIQPDLCVVSVFLRMESLLLYYKYGIRPVILTTYLREPDQTFLEECVKVVVALPGDAAIPIIEFIKDLGFKFSSLRDLLQPAATFQELIVCPKELDLPSPAASGNVHHIGPSIFQDRNIGDKPDFNTIRNGRKIIYASLGSFALYRESCDLFFRTIVRIMSDKELDGFHLILSVGFEYDTTLLQPLPENVTVMRWASKIDILREASLMITHGGLGTIKECIYCGVPMIVFPMMYDQFRNASLVDYHNLGISRRIGDLSAGSLSSDILYVSTDRTLLENVNKMQYIFREKEEREEGVSIIRQLLISEENRTTTKPLY